MLAVPMRPLLFLLFLGSSFAPLLSQSSGLPPGGARGLAMGGTGLTFTDVHAVWTNPAAMTEVEQLEAAAYGELRYGQAELKLVNAAACFPTASGTFGVSLSYFGFESYNEQSIGVAYGRKLFDKLSIGAQVFAFSTRIPDYGNQIRPAFELGLYSALTSRMRVGFRVRNPQRIELLDGEYLPTYLSLGAQYRPSEQLRLLAEVEKDLRASARFRGGFEYDFAELLHLRLGVASSPSLFSFGVGYQIGERLVLDVAATYHDVLGITPAVGLRYRGE